MCCTLELTLSSKELFLEQAFPRKYIIRTLSAIVVKGSSEHKKVYVNAHDWAALWLVDWLLRIRAWQIFREDYFYK